MPVGREGGRRVEVVPSLKAEVEGAIQGMDLPELGFPDLAPWLEASF